MSAWSVIRAVLRRPIAAFVLGLALGALAILSRPIGFGRPAPNTWTVLKAAGGVTVHWDDAPGAPPEGAPIGRVHAWVIDRPEGFFAHTVRRTGVSLAIRVPESTDAQIVRRLILDDLKTAPDARRQGLLARGAGAPLRATVLWNGVLVNAAAVVMTAGLVTSWFLQPGYLREQRRIRAERANHCAACGYDLRGLTGQTCPECGSSVSAPVSASEPSPASASPPSA